MIDLTEEERDALVNPNVEPTVETCQKALDSINELKARVRELEAKHTDWVAVYDFGANTAKYRRVEAVLIHGRWLVNAADLPGFKRIEPR